MNDGAPRGGRPVDGESVFLEVLVAVVATPRSTGEIVAVVRAAMGCVVPAGTIRTALGRAAEHGAAVEDFKEYPSGHRRSMWREPVDALSEGMSEGMSGEKTPSVRDDGSTR